MAHPWPQGFESEFFSPDEFDHPDLMDPGYIKNLDMLRMRCGFAVRINDDARTRAELEHLYRKEIAKGQKWPSDSAHAGEDEHGEPLPQAVRASDIEPVPGSHPTLTYEEMELELLYQILRMWKEGHWPKLGLGVETGHLHVDDTPRLGAKRPAFWVAVSR